MPQLLRTTAIRHFEASVEFIEAAIMSLQAPRRTSPRVESVQRAPSISLIGASAELAMSACLIQAFGEKSLILANGHYKSGSQITQEFRTFVRDGRSNTSFLTKGIDNPSQHRDALWSASCKLQLLSNLRAGGLHAGRAPNLDICVSVINDILAFQSLLAMSGRLHPYLSPLPSLNVVRRDATLIIEELAALLDTASGDEERSTTLSSLFLVLPNLPEDEPEWLGAFERAVVAPNQRDIAVLLDVVDKARPGTLRRVSRGGGDAMPVRVEPGSQTSIPIEPQWLRAQFSRLSDQFVAHVGTANGHIDNGLLDTPPQELVQQLFVEGLEDTGIVQADQGLTPHQAWPFIASSLATSGNGTPGPYWFVVRQTSDMHQLTSLLQRAGRCGSATLRKRLTEFQEGSAAITDNRPLTEGKTELTSLLAQLRSAEKQRDLLGGILDKYRDSDRRLPSDSEAHLCQALDNGLPLGTTIESVVQSQETMPDSVRRYWARILCESVRDLDDASALVLVLRTAGLSAAHTAARKALRLLDFVYFGPTVNPPAEGVPAEPRSRRR